MKQVYFIPLSSRERHIEDDINNAIANLEKTYKLEWLPELFIAPDSDKFMLVYDKEAGAGSASPSLGVKVVQGSQNKLTTEKILNDTMLQLETDEDKNFISLYHPAEFVYIILYENKAGTFPRIKIVPNPPDPKSGNIKLSMFLQAMAEDEEWKDLQPYESFMLDKNNMVLLFAEE